MKKTLGFCFLAGMAALCAVPTVVSAGPMDDELVQFVSVIREQKRSDRIGYLVFVPGPGTQESEDRIIGTAGKVLFTCSAGSLTHVDAERLRVMRKAGLAVSIIDKKLLDDATERWYLAWVEDDRQEKALREKFEPLFSRNQTRVIRIRPADEEVLARHSIRYSALDESLLPPRTPMKPGLFKSVTVDPTISAEIAKIRKAEMVETVQTLENFKSRWAYEPGNAKAMEWLTAEFNRIGGLTVSNPTFVYNKSRFANVIAVQKGTQDPNTVIVLCAHFDSTGGNWGPSNQNAPGADDNGSGVTGMLHIARVAARLPLPYTVIYAGMNVEELGLHGSKAFARELSTTPGTKILAALDLDMIADKDDNLAVAIGNTRSNWLIDVFKDAAQAYTGLNCKCLYDSDVWGSDHSSFWNIGASAILTSEGYPDFSPHYHKPTDLVKNLSPEMMEKIARSNLATLLTLSRPQAVSLAAR